jgi:hypothetical protein
VKTLSRVFGILISLFLSFPALYGQEASSNNSKGDPLTISGFVDIYYSNNLARPANHTNKFRNFDVTENQFTLSLAEVVLQKAASPLGFRIDADFGPTNDLVQGGTQSTLAYLQQAYLTAVIPVGSGLTLDAGKFVTHMGLEVIAAKDNWNYSRSFLFAWAIPYYHVGVRASYPVTGVLTLAGFLYNGCNCVVDNNSGKTLGASISVAPTSSLSIIGNWIGGPEQPDSISGSRRNVFDAAVNLQLNDKFSLALDADYGAESLPTRTPRWKAAALYAKYSLGEASDIAFRGEVYSDPDGYTTGMAQVLREITLTYERRFLANLVLRAEFRHDWSTITAFDGNAGSNVLKHQNTLVIGTIFKF